MREWLANAARAVSGTIHLCSAADELLPEGLAPGLVILGPGALRQWTTRSAGNGHVLALLAPGDEELEALSAGADDCALDEPSHGLAARVRIAIHHARQRAAHGGLLGDARALLRDVPYSVIAFDRDGLVRWVNRAAAETSGYRPEALIGQPVKRFLAGEAAVDETAIMTEVLTRGGATVESRFADAHGRIADVRVTISPIGSGRSIAGFLAVIEDMSEQKQALRELEQAHDLFESVFSQTLAGITIADAEGRFVWVNDAALRVMGRSREEVVGVDQALLFPERWRDQIRALYAAAIANPGPIEPIDLPIIRPDGSRCFITMTRATFRAPDGRAYGVTTLVDISAIKRSEEELARSAAIIASTDDAIVSRDRDGRIIGWNKGAERMLGYTAQEAIGSRFVGHLTPEQDAQLTEEVASVFAGNVVRQETTRRRPDGSVIDVSLTIFPVHDARGRVISGTSIARDITERKRAAEAVRQAEAYLRATLADAPVVLLATDLHGILTVAEGAPLVELGFPSGSLVGRHISALGPLGQSEVEARRGALRGERTDHTVRFGGRVFESRTGPLYAEDETVSGIIAVAVDVTERVRSEQALLQAQKLESLGVLAGGVAHDFNNLLVGILGNAGLALAELPPSSPLHETIQGIERAGQRAAELARQMLAYSGKGQFVIERMDLNGLVAEMSHLLRSSITPGAALDRQLTPELPPVQVDATQVRQVVMNLVVNASDALKDGAGTIRISTGRTHARRGDLEGAYYAPEFRDGEHVFFEVADDGIGMTPETRERIFDPFFTTKFTGRGLGLAAVLGIVRGHRGAIHVTSQAGAGSTFRLLLPAAAPAAVEQPPPPPAVPVSRQSAGTILVIDDEPTVRAVTSRALGITGYTPLTAEDGEAGLALLRVHARDVHAVLLDMTMPGMDGATVLAEIRRDWPALPVIMMSGYSEQMALAQLGGHAIQGFIQKPYAIDTLLRALASAAGSQVYSGE
jgi:two-component system, cell cycle sensor histidine kinase and response regulator CckA